MTVQMLVASADWRLLASATVSVSAGLAGLAFGLQLLSSINVPGVHQAPVMRRLFSLLDYGFLSYRIEARHTFILCGISTSRILNVLVT